MAETEQQTQQTDKPAETPAKPKQLTKAEREFQERQRAIQLNKAEQVATSATSIFDPIAYAQLKTLAADLIAGGATSPDAKTPEQLLVKLQAGYELGMTPVQAQNSLYIVNGKTNIWGAALIARLRLQGWAIRYLNESADECTIQVTKGSEVIEDTFQYQDAVDSGYTKSNDGKEKIGWKKGQNRKLKMRYGAAAQLVKTYLPEVLGGNNIGVQEIDGEVIEGHIAEDSEARKERMAAAEAERANLSKDFVAKAEA